MHDLEEEAAQILSRKPFWRELSPRERERVAERSTIKRFAKNQLIGGGDSSCVGVVFVLDGGMRVSLISDEGREITLWRLGRGDCCVTTASCVISQIRFDTVVTATDETALLVIPSSVCSTLMNDNVHFRAFVYEREIERFSQAIQVIQELLFKRFDKRLATYLLSRFDETGDAELRMTQEEMARDVNSAREVVARMLRRFSSEGLVTLGRGRVVLQDIRGLRAIARDATP